MPPQHPMKISVDQHNSTGYQHQQRYGQQLKHIKANFYAIKVPWGWSNQQWQNLRCNISILLASCHFISKLNTKHITEELKTIFCIPGASHQHHMSIEARRTHQPLCGFVHPTWEIHLDEATDCCHQHLTCTWNNKVLN